MNNKTKPLQVTPELIEFLDKAIVNRIIKGKDNKARQRPSMQRIVVNYFKLNNDRYLELINMEYKKC
jgi:hypothetical protein